MLETLKKAYEKAIKENKESFIYEGEELIISYAKYLIEYLETHSPKTKTKNP